MSTIPRVSVVMPFLNVRPYLQEAVQSVINQTYGRWELLLVDDGSTDGSEVIAEEMARSDPRIRIFAHSGRMTRGASAARNLGLRNAQGEYVALLDGDDVWLPDKLAEHVPLMDSNPDITMLYGNTLYWYSWTGAAEDRDRDSLPTIGVPVDARIAGSRLLQLGLLGVAAVPCTCSTLIRRDAIEKVGGFEQEFRHIYTDQIFYMKLLSDAQVFVADGCHDYYRRHSASAWSTVRRTGKLPDAHRRYLIWSRDYLDAAGMGGTPLARTVAGELRWIDRPPLMRRARKLMFKGINRLRSAWG